MSRILKYGENAWQTPAYFDETITDDPLAIANFELVAGDAPSYNNICDLDRLLQTITHIAAGFDGNGHPVPHIAVGAKHGNACGVGIGSAITAAAVLRMLEGDPRAIMGGWVILNHPVDALVADRLVHCGMSSLNRRLLDGVAAPEFSREAIDLLGRKKGKCRLMQNRSLADLSASSLDQAERFRYIRGGKLRQPNYAYVAQIKDVVREDIFDEVIVAWAVGSTSNSNTITLVSGHKLIGNGVGQQDRVSACQLAVKRAWAAGHDTLGAVAYSDSFFPFDDGPKVLVEAGIRAIMTSSASVNDNQVIDYCRSAGVDLIMIPDVVGRGFFGH